MSPNKKYKQIQYVYVPDGNPIPDKFLEKLRAEAIRLVLNELE